MEARLSTLFFWDFRLDYFPVIPPDNYTGITGIFHSLLPIPVWRTGKSSIIRYPLPQLK
jgi:hypothetical protein